MNKQSPPISDLVTEVELCLHQGRYDEAFDLIKSELSDLDRNGHSAGERADLNLIFGLTIGFCGTLKKFPNAQETSKDLLFKARSYFEEIDDQVKLAKCENGLANAYERLGEINEARIWLIQALNRDITETSPERLYSYLVESILNFDEKQFGKIVRKLGSYQPLFEKSNDLFLKGVFYNQIGVAHKNLGNFERGIENLEKARDCIKTLNHLLYLSSILNNLAHLYLAQKRYAEAFESASRARKLFARLGDDVHEAFVIDTLAIILFEQKKYARAEKYINASISRLEKLGKKNFLIEALFTKIKISAALGKIREALELSNRAENLIPQVFDPKRINIFDATVTAIHKVFTEKQKSELLKTKQFWMPDDNTFYENYAGILMTDQRLRRFGIVQNNLAIIELDNARSGDLAAVYDFETNQTFCGFLTDDLGLVGLEMPGRKTYVFDKSQVKILGKIVGKVTDPFGNFPVIEAL